MSRLLVPALVTALAVGTVLGAAAPSASDDVSRVARAGQWQLGALRLPQAWRTSKGAGVVVAVLDTGVNARHPDLAGAVIQGPDLTGVDASPHRWGRHGTAMASLIAGRGHRDEQEGGVLGVAPRAKVLSVRVTLDNGDPQRVKLRSGGRNALARGIRYAADHGAGVISMSLGGGSGAWEGSAPEEEAVQYAISRGAVLVASSGNDGASANRKNFPAAYPGVIAVGAVNRRLTVAGFSNRQDYVSVVAPGTKIVTADERGSYVVGDGTSSAAALVAGVAALVRSAYPSLSPYHVRQAIELGTRKRPADGHSPAYGHGVVDAVRTLRAAARLDVPPSGEAAPERYFCQASPSSRGPVVAGMVVLVAAMSARVLVTQRRRRRRGVT
ncbi:type VII secretion-associated serine protease mycosin [Nonomuraea longispora]|uniref:Type VII secretion-associated serine protease mycosin n=1 Tax=Nonomuraea longispora TaxID=1848320 RepID=A0A4R4NQN6_9ACTN|nr:S8 family serine peptidase [Nonomuraea longispora]TDC09452.1 type VII secretion-associated serine protease mycosin [Nonomuraea longispora]